jgi:hypothetical protein
MKRTIFLTALALLISAGITAQGTGQTQAQKGPRNQSQVQNGTQNQTQSQIGDQSQLQTHKRYQLRKHDQTGSGDQIRKRDQARLHDPSLKMSRTGTQNAQMRNQGASQVHRTQPNASLRNSAMNHNMRTSAMGGAKRR